MSKDIKRIKAFRGRQTYINGVLSVFENVGFEVEYVYDNEPDKRSWGARIQPNEDFGLELGSRNELLLWVDAYDEFDSRSLNRIREALSEARPRLREDVAFFVSKDSKVAEKVSALPSDTTIIAFSLEQIRSYRIPAGPDFRRHLLLRVFARNPYLFTGAVVQYWQFFGRGRIINELIAAVNNGERIGLFGLRKIGKTSLLLRLIEQLKTANSSLITAHLQVARIDAIRRTAPYFLWSLAQAIYLNLPSRVQAPNFRLLGRYEVFTDIPDAGIQKIPDYFLYDINLILRRQTVRLCLVFDEIERMWPSSRDSATSQWLSEFPKIWQLIRSLDQEHPTKIAIIVAGTNPQCVEQAKVGQRENPLFQYIQVRYLPFLEREDANLLLKDLGGRGGLHWNDDACRLAYEQVSGHPALLRFLGSAVYKEVRDHERRRIISERDVADATSATRREATPILNEMCGALEDGYPDDYLLLRYLAQNRVGEFVQYSSVFPDAVQHLQGFGLISSASQPAVAFSLLQTHIQLVSREAPETSASSFVPTEIANCKIISSLGRAGGFGKVFKAQAVTGETIALKLLYGSSLSALNREVDILKELNHSNVVRFIDSGHDIHGNYILMEFLDGTPWSIHCTRATRINGRDAKEDLLRLLGALEYIHPKANARRGLTELTIQEILAARLGYVHRDIKPENIISVARRGPVLIDFGIASKSGDPTKTTSATPGYLPADFVAGVWGPDVDLYQLGITFIQVLVGEVFTGTSDQLSDLRVLLERDTTISNRSGRQCSAFAIPTAPNGSVPRATPFQRWDILRCRLDPCQSKKRRSHEQTCCVARPETGLVADRLAAGRRA